MVSEMGTILTSLRIYTFELKTTVPFQVVDPENKIVHLLADIYKNEMLIVMALVRRSEMCHGLPLRESPSTLTNSAPQ